MAEELRIGSANVKERSPLGVWLLIVVTLGIYGLVHWYKINREMRDYSQEAGAPLGNDPTASLLALFPGGILIVPAIWTWVTTTQRAQAVRRLVGRRADRGAVAVPGRAAGLHLRDEPPVPAVVAQRHLADGGRDGGPGRRADDRARALASNPTRSRRRRLGS